MFLAMTADHKFWSKTQPLLFLGEWCKLYKNRDLFKGKEHKTLPYHWDDRKKFESDRIYINNLYEKYIDQFTRNLNKVHNLNYSQRYWRLLIGLWLREFIENLFDRYLSIKSAIESGSIDNTWILKSADIPPIIKPNYDDQYNLYLYSHIIKMFGSLPFEEKEECNAREKIKFSIRIKIIKILNKFKGKTINRLIIRVFQILLKKFLTKIYPYFNFVFSQRISFAGYIYLSSWDMAKLQLSIRQIPYIFHGEENIIKINKPDYNLRNQLKFIENSDFFESILNSLLPSQVPMIYLENYNEFKLMSIKNPKNKPKIIVTAYSMLHRQSFEFWAAQHAEENGTKLFFLQHGGGFGSALFMSMEEHVAKAFDGYYTWGANFEKMKNTRKMPALRLQTTCKNLSSSNQNGGILWLAARYPRYKISMDNGLSGPHMSQYINEQIRLIDLLVTSAQMLLVRRYHNDTWEEESIFRDRFPWLKIQFCQAQYNAYTIKTDFAEQLQRFSLAIATCNETTYLETLAANFPTIVYWNPKFFELRNDVKIYFNQLVQAGILHYTPESAAAMVNRVFKNPNEWWQSSEVQTARKLFCDHLAYTSTDWLKIWKTELIYQRDYAQMS
jgi:putative transferase (TIGR04331 family)